eukprot:5507610-Prorocentrum_lima.AAC.1
MIPVCAVPRHSGETGSNTNTVVGDTINGRLNGPLKMIPLIGRLLPNPRVGPMTGALGLL